MYEGGECADGVDGGVDGDVWNMDWEWGGSLFLYLEGAYSEPRGGVHLIAMPRAVCFPSQLPI